MLLSLPQATSNYLPWADICLPFKIQLRLHSILESFLSSPDLVAAKYSLYNLATLFECCCNYLFRHLFPLLEIDLPELMIIFFSLYIPCLVLEAWDIILVLEYKYLLSLPLDVSANRAKYKSSNTMIGNEE